MSLESHARTLAMALIWPLRAIVSLDKHCGYTASDQVRAAFELDEVKLCLQILVLFAILVVLALYSYIMELKAYISSCGFVRGGALSPAAMIRRVLRNASAEEVEGNPRAFAVRLVFS